MPIKTTIAVGADVEKFKASYAAFQKYQDALKKLYGEQVKNAPYLKATAAVGGDLSKFLNLDQIARSQANFATAAQKAGHAFRGLGSGVVRTLEGFARVALSPLQILFPAGLVVGLAGIGAGLAGIGAAGALYGLDREAADVSDRRRRALGLGVSYGSLSAYDLNFQRFGVGEGTLGAVAGGIYDVTSPEYLGLFSSGSTGHGDTSEAAIDLIRRIPEILNGVPDSMVGPVARSRNLTSLLDLPTIIRLRSHPEEIEAQVARYRQDRKTLDIGKDAQEKWSSFNAAIERAGLDIETALGKNLVALAPGLTKFSDDAVRFIDALVDSGAMTNALKGIESGLRWLDEAIGSTEFKQYAKRFLSGLETLGPYIADFVDYAAKVLRVAGRGAYYGAKLAGDDSYNPNMPTFLGDLAGQRQPRGVPPPGAAYNRLPSIRYFAGHGSSRPAYPSGVIDSATGKLIPGPRTITTLSPQSMSDIPDLSGESTYSRKGEPIQDVRGFIWHHTGSRGTPEDIIRALNQRGLGVQYVMDRNGRVYHALPEGTRGAHILPSEINDLSNSNTEGMEVIANDDSDVTMAQVAAAQKFATEFSKLHPGVQYFGHGEVNPSHKQATEGLTIANAVRHGLVPVISPSASSVVPLNQRTLLNFAGGSADAEPAPLQLPGATAPQAVGEGLGFDNNVGIRNRSLRNRGRALHILDHVEKSAPPGPIVIHDMTGGSAQVTVSRHEAAF